MKLISLNLWGGIVHDPLITFVRDHAPSTDIFCFQELLFGTDAHVGSEGQHEDIFQEISKILAGFDAYPMFAAPGSRFQGELLPEGVRAGQAIFIKKDSGITVTDKGEFYTYLPDSAFARENPPLTITGNLNYIRAKINDQELLIATMHGVWQAEGKGDTPDRLEQSRIAAKFFETVSCPKVFCGDFNMSPDTESMTILESVGLRNLIKEYKITTTRSPLYDKPAKFADYTMVSPEITIKNFEVPQIVISDHLPMITEFEI
jgi:hypothetical protein